MAISPKRPPALSSPRRGRRPAVVALIKDYILRNNLAPGDAMPTESELSEALDASRSSVREAIKTLSALDIVEVRHGHGTYVGGLTLSALVESLAFRGMLTSSDDTRVVADLIDVREVIETGLADQIAAGVSDETVARLRGLADEMAAKAAAGQEFPDADRAFHHLLMSPSGNELATQLSEAFWDVHTIVTGPLGPVSDLTSTAQAHAAIVDAVEAHDAQRLRRAITDHYRPIRERISAPR